MSVSKYKKIQKTDDYILSPRYCFKKYLYYSKIQLWHIQVPTELKTRLDIYACCNKRFNVGQSTY